MARIFNQLASDQYPNILTGNVVNVNARNVSPSTITATASGTTFDVTLLSNYDMFNVAQTSAGTDFISLPASIAVGTELYLFATSACKVSAAGSGTINGVSNSTAITLAANSLSIMRKVTSTAWLLGQTSSAGVVTGPTS